MTNLVRLFNKSKRTITGNGYTFAPDQAMAFQSEEASKLQKLYAGEIISMEDVKKQFEEAPAKEPDATAPSGYAPVPLKR